ncbi:hypothetical protein JAAARDRAFT_37935 [Jaapia argillacea MUCL 33604]|uniref:Uncharacterized protein n=1 Tax=Jaapia argillacea MUCL 33604 TaxID=933084 RepID=A0A067PU65_9AGAM|nr:hypothetical protein JAAARDRAFT_37935 [Jaapia argillacea MUCL 33604]
MPLRLRPSPLRCPTALSIRSPCLRIVPLGFRSLHDAPASDFASKYADKLQQRAQQ